MSITFLDGVFGLVPKAQMICTEDKIVEWHDSRPQPSQSEINAKISELRDAEPMRRLREERNRRLAETDWWAMKEVDGWQMSPQQRVYRKNLRDLPETSPYPMLNENDELTNIDWPEKP